MRQIAWRTLGRLIKHEVLWNGNRERLREVASWDPERSIVRWAWTQHAAYQVRYTACMKSPSFAHLRFIRLSSRAQARDWMTATRERAPAPRSQSSP